MRDRHLPRLCQTCEAPLARQQDACWRCHTAVGPSDVTGATAGTPGVAHPAVP
jgi:predicted amidophosphoribosyltransferase